MSFLVRKYGGFLRRVALCVYCTIVDVYSKSRAVFIAFALVSVLSFGGFAHAAIPHEHGDGHTGAQSSLWSDLHAILSGVQRKMMFAAASPLLLVLLFRTVLYSERTFLRVRESAEIHVRSLDPVFGKLLRTGVVPHRAFR